MHTLLILFSLLLALGGCLLCLGLLRLVRPSNSRRAVQLTGLLIPTIVLSLLASLMAHFLARVCYWTAPPFDVAVAQTLSVIGALGITAAVLLNLLRAVLLPWHLRRRTWEAPAWLEHEAQLIAGEAGLRRAPNVRVALDERPWALITGLVRPHLVVSSSLVTLLDREEMAAVLHHELAHVRRGDLWWTSLGGVLRDLTWFIPATRRLYALMLSEQEIACDDQIVGTQRRVALASALARVWHAGQACANGDPVLRGALGIFSPLQAAHLEGRVRRLLDKPGLSKAPVAYATIPVLGGMLAAVVVGQIWISLLAMDQMGCDLPQLLWSILG